MDSNVEVDECMEIHQCDLCVTFFNSNFELFRHKAGGHMCEFCNFIYWTVKGKENHLRICTDQNVIPVSVLNDKDAEDIVVIDTEKDGNSQEVNENVDSSNVTITLDSEKAVTQPQTVDCDTIHEEFVVNSRPNIQVDFNKVKCDLCDAIFCKKSEHKCEFCNAIYKSVKAKENHLKKSHSFKCPKCDLSFVSKKLCKVHTLNCNHENKCNLCDTSFTYKQLVVHKKAGHKCEFCNAIYKSVKAKENHLKKSHSFKCPKCDLSFVSKKLCTDHRKSHTKQQTFNEKKSQKLRICDEI